MTTITEQDIDILRHRFGLEGTKRKTLEELAELYGCSREQVRWRESRALKAAGSLLAQRRSTSEIGDGDTAHRPKPTRRLVF